MSEPAFYIASVDTIPLLAPRACYPIRRIRTRKRDDFLLTRVTPPIPAAKVDLSEVVLAAHYQGDTLFPINSWPMHVYVCRVLNDEIARTGQATPDDLEIVYWAELFPNLSQALQRLIGYEGQPRV